MKEPYLHNPKDKEDLSKPNKSISLTDIKDQLIANVKLNKRVLL